MNTIKHQVIMSDKQLELIQDALLAAEFEDDESEEMYQQIVKMKDMGGNIIHDWTS